MFNGEKSFFKQPHIDRHMDFFSLDDIYYFGGQSSHNQIALLDHQAQSSNEISMKIGDIIGILLKFFEM